MYKNILVGVDTSDESQLILEKADHYAQLFKARLTVVHVVDLPTNFYEAWMEQPLIGLEQVQKTCTTRLERLTESLRTDNIQLIVESGHAVNTLIGIAEEEKIDLIILGSHSRQGLGRLIGSTANGVIHHAKCDVLAIRMET